MNHIDNPLVVSFGGGVDSTALLIGLWMRGIRPTAILFADTGAELPETYGHVWAFSAWLEEHGMPAVQVVRYVPKQAKYDTLEGKCLANETLPSKAFGFHSCSIVFKAGPMDRWVLSQTWAKAHIAAGGQVARMIGYDAGDRDTTRANKSRRTFAKPTEDARWSYSYPLQAWGWDRAACVEVIEAAGAPVPRKSSCFFCPSMKRDEIADLRANHPDLFARAIAMEERARDGKHGLKSTKGLGRRFAWGDLA